MCARHTCAALGAALLLACSALLHERPSPRLISIISGEAAGQRKRSAAGRAGSDDEGAAPARARLELLKLLVKMRRRWVFWAMVLTVFAYTPIVEYSTHVTSYLREMQSDARPTRNGFVSHGARRPFTPLYSQRV